MEPDVVPLSRQDGRLPVDLHLHPPVQGGHRHPVPGAVGDDDVGGGGVGRLVHHGDGQAAGGVRGEAEQLLLAVVPPAAQAQLGVEQPGARHVRPDPEGQLLPGAGVGGALLEPVGGGGGGGVGGPVPLLPLAQPAGEALGARAAEGHVGGLALGDLAAAAVLARVRVAGVAAALAAAAGEVGLAPADEAAAAAAAAAAVRGGVAVAAVLAGQPNARVVVAVQQAAPHLHPRVHDGSGGRGGGAQADRAPGQLEVADAPGEARADSGPRGDPVHLVRVHPADPGERAHVQGAEGARGGAGDAGTGVHLCLEDKFTIFRQRAIIDSKTNESNFCLIN